MTVILVANEQEINVDEKSENDELRYLVAANEKIKWPVENTFLGRKTEGNNQPVSLEELERRKSLVFDKNKGNEKYKKVKEKLIGVTLHYQADYQSICKSFINSNFSDDSKYKKCLLNRIKTQCETMSWRGHNNLRTYQFFISRIKNIEVGTKSILTKYSGDEEIKIIEKIIDVCFLEAIKNKRGDTKDEPQFDDFGNRISFDAITKYIESGELDISAINKNITTYVNSVLRITIDKTDVYSQLIGTYFINTEEKDQGLYDEFLLRLEQDKYPLNAYPDILMRISALLHIGFPEKYLTDVKDRMIKNVKTKTSEELMILDDSVIHLIEERERRELVKKCIDELNQVIRDTQNTNIRSRVKDLIQLDNWADELNKISIELNGINDNAKTGIISELSAEDWIIVLKKSTLDQLYEFSGWLKKWLGIITPDTNMYSMEYEICISIRDKLAKEEKTNFLGLNDRIKNYWLSWIYESLDTFVEKHKQS